MRRWGFSAKEAVAGFKIGKDTMVVGATVSGVERSPRRADLDTAV
ncbi:hypothetical protein M6B38_223610 [Iris pallida]|uniref:Uncharacterized protein n=1 Tax=Iris pallida TaxID=29817 RepID=A0AAX6DVN9_IRIPA|nr:hypothetical protein M6B38_223610 [Iris pallida]